MDKATEDNILRDVNIDGYRLVVYDTGRLEHRGYPELGYYFFNRDYELIFHGEEFSVLPGGEYYPERAVNDLLGFLTIKPGDTDDEYFEDYNAKQMHFALNEAEDLSIHVDDENPPVFPDTSSLIWELKKE